MAKLYWGALMSGKTRARIQKGECDLETFFLLPLLLRPFDLSQRLWLLMCEKVILAWRHAFTLHPCLCTVLEMLFWMLVDCS